MRITPRETSTYRFVSDYHYVLMFIREHVHTHKVCSRGRRVLQRALWHVRKQHHKGDDDE